MSYTHQFLIILVLVMLGSVKVTMQGAMGRRYIKCAQDSVLFNILFFFSIAMFVAVIFGLGEITLPLILWAAAVSVFNVMYQLIYSIALSVGPVSLTVLIVNCSVFITTIASVIMFDEQVYITQLVAIIFLAASMLLSVKKTGDGRRASVKWLVLVIISMLSCGIAVVLQKAFSVSYRADTDGASSSTFLFLAYTIGALILLVVYFIRAHTGRGERSTAGIRPGMLLFALGMGLALGIYQKVNVYGMAIIDGAFFYPTYNGLMSVVMSVIGILFFHDELDAKQKLGILCGIVSVVLMNIRWLPL